jgi:hypothetical protein
VVAIEGKVLKDRGKCKIAHNWSVSLLYPLHLRSESTHAEYPQPKGFWQWLLFLEYWFFLESPGKLLQ